jgi:hypothetical protein
MDDKLTIFIAVTAAAVVTQMLILAVIAAIMWRLAARVQDLQSHAMPLIEDSKKLAANVQTLLETARPKVDIILDNASAISTTAREQTQKLDATLTGFMDHARLQAIRADEMLTRTFDRVEGATSKVENTVMSPLRHLNGVLQGIGAGLDTLFQKSRQPKNGRQNDEMFI